MTDIIDNFRYRRSLLEKLNYEEAKGRLAAFLSWLEITTETRKILSNLEKQANGKAILEEAEEDAPPNAFAPEEIAAVGLELIRKSGEGKDISLEYGITPSFQTNSIQAHFDEAMRRYIWPFIEYVERELRKSIKEDESMASKTLMISNVRDYPLEITESINRFIKDYQNYKRNAFIMMPFGETKGHQDILSAIRSTLEKYGIKGLRADDKCYHDDLFPNVLTYLWGCSIGIAVFERLEADDFNPNVSLEVGYMRALGKPICLLKDKTLKTLQTDLIGKLYTTFDPQDPKLSIPDSLEKWLRDKEIITL